MKTKRFAKTFGIIEENIDIDSSTVAKAYYPLYLIRRLAFAAVLTVFYEYPMRQLEITIGVVVLPVLFGARSRCLGIWLV